MSDTFNEPAPKIRGYSAYNQPATRGPRTCARILNLSIYLSFLAGIFLFLNYGPGILQKTLGLGTLIAGVIHFLGRKLWGANLGELLWGLRLDGKKLIQKERPHLGTQFLSGLATLLIATASVTFFGRYLVQNPLISPASPIQLEAFAPPPGDVNWQVLPYFYALGAWPALFEGKPIFYTLPYEKGLPIQFLGKVTARWEMPSTRLTFEGPLTPTGLTESGTAERCYLRPWTSPIDCLEMRSLALVRHLKAIHQAGLTPDSLQWFEVKNASVFENERPRGVLITAKSDRDAQARYILITPKGAHQAFVFDYPRTERGERARVLFEQAIRSQRIYTDLSAGRTWVERALQDVKLDTLKSLNQSDQQWMALAKIHALLIASVTVDPRNYESLYHLGGTASLLIKFASLRQNSDLTAVAKPLLSAAAHYARDVRPTDPRNAVLEDLVLEAAKK